MLASFYRGIIVFLSLVSMAHAEVLLEKVKSPGFVMTSYAVSSRCTISDTGLLTTQLQLGELLSKRNTQLQLTTLKVKARIKEAALGNITTNSFPVDAATISYRAYQKQLDGTLKQILLFEQNGGSGVESKNNTEAAITLRNFIDLNCGDPLIY
jgi:hypothetical protein